MEYNNIQIQNEGPVCILAIDRPELGNKLNIACMEELVQALGDAEADMGCGAIVLTGNGRCFCNGGELGDYRRQSSIGIRQFGTAFIKLHMTIHKLGKPVIAAVQGDAAGGGLNLVEACDLAVASSDATFAVPEISAGIAPMMALTGLVRVKSRKGTMEMALLGKPIEAAQALDSGLVNWICPREEVVTKAVEIAREISARNPVAVAMLKTLYGQIAAPDYEKQMEIGLNVLVALLKSEDAAEAIRAREESREPVWQGR
jgi:enoyl-CoA hydratase/carnithine racemase